MQPIQKPVICPTVAPGEMPGWLPVAHAHDSLFRLGAAIGSAY